MGGALATLAAEHFIDKGRTPYLYTFGAPRVGMLPHVRYMKEKMGNRISRYYYSSDIVTWLPPFPYVHLPGKRLVTTGKWIGGHNDYRFSRNLVRAYGDDQPRKNKEMMDEAARLIDEGENAGGGFGIESRAMRFMMKALHKLLWLAGGIIGTAVVTSVTIIDQIVALISHFANRNRNARPLVWKWIVGALTALGKIVPAPIRNKVGEIGGFLRYVLNLIFSGIRVMLGREAREAERRRGGQVIVRFA